MKNLQKIINTGATYVGAVGGGMLLGGIITQESFLDWTGVSVALAGLCGYIITCKPKDNYKNKKY